MKNTLFSKILLILMTLSLAFTLAACGTEAAAGVDPGELEALRRQVEALSDRVAALEQRSGLAGWSLEADPWANGGGAAVRFSATPVNPSNGQTAALVVRLEDQEVASLDCVWDGTSFLATAELEAADGYSYYCLLTSPDGTREQLALNTPENPVDDTLVYLRTSLIAYGNLVVESWHDAGGKLTISSGYAQVQMPRLASGGGEITYTSADLVLRRNGQELGRHSLDLPAGEGRGSYEAVLTDVAFDMPDMAEADQLELWLEVTLSTGAEVLASGGSWSYFDGELVLAVG